MHASRVAGRDLHRYPDLHEWSVSDPDRFWSLWLEHSGIDVEGEATPPHDGGDFQHRRWFPGLRLSAARHLLRHAADAQTAAGEALVAVTETESRHSLSHGRLADAVLDLRERLQTVISPGDRVAAVVPNGVEAVVAMLAVVSLGGVWSSASPDFGVQAIVDRFAQIDPVVFIGCTGYRYGGRTYTVADRMEEVRRRLPGVRRALAVESLPEASRSASSPSVGFDPFPSPWNARERTPDERAASLAALPTFPFDHPMYTMFSSGTTGTPKCIVHGVGGTLLQHSKEHILHSEIHAGDRVLYFTTCGWMMWNWLVSALGTGATVVLYDGSPVEPGPDHLWNLAASERLTHLGVSPRFLSACRASGVSAVDRTASLRVLFSTGAPLLPEEFDYVYRDLAPHVQLASISGGTDIISCFMLGVPTLPVRRGEIQAAGLGMDIAAVAADGTPLFGERGELVCRVPFPSRPLTFHGDVDGSRYRAAYFERFPGWWTHGDYVEITGTVETIGGVVVYGRSDATLNPGGVRIGTAEIYRHVESMPEVADSLVVGRPVGGDVEVVLFVVPAAGITIDAACVERIRLRIRENASPRHVPARVFAVSAVPYTRSGKKVEIAVRDILAGGIATNADAMANPEALKEYQDLAREIAGE